MLTVTPVTQFNSMLDRMASLSRAMDQALKNVPAEGTTMPNWIPSLDAFETERAYVVTLDLPGVDQKEIELNFERNTLTVRGTRQTQADVKDESRRVFFAERESGTFERALRFPQHVNGDKISAAFANGVLTITVPKAESALPRKIAIGATA